MTTLLLEQPWSKELKALYSKYPAVIRSSRFDDIRRMVDRGELDKADELARSLQDRNPRIKAENIIARRMRIERASLFTRLSQAERELRDIFNNLGDRLAQKIERKADSRGNLPSLYRAVHDTAVELGRSLRTWMTSIVRDSATLGLKNAGNAFLPIFKDNWESILKEDKLSIGLNKAFANRTDPRVKMSSAKWKNIVTGIVYKQAQSRVRGQSYSEKIWDLKGRTETEMKRLLANEIASGSSPYSIAQKVKKYLSPKITKPEELTEPLPRGVYASPFKNAWRLARTEAGRAYTDASAKFAQDKKWITGVRITLSPAHVDEDICDELADGSVISPEEFAEKIPAHPNCMCYPTFQIADEFLEDLNV